MAPLTCPVCAAQVRPGDLICNNCGANLARHEPPPQQYPPQQGQGQGQGQYPQDQYQQDQYPPQGQYGPPPQQDQYAPPPQHDQYTPPPQQDQYAPSPQQPPYSPQPQQQYAPPQQPPYSPPQDQYSPAPQQKPQDQYGSPPQQDQYGPPQGQPGYPPPQDQYGAPPKQPDQYPPPQQQSPYSPPPQQQQYAPPQQDQYAPPQGQPGYPPQRDQYGAPQQEFGNYVPPSPPVQTPQAPPDAGSTASYTPFCPHCGADIPDIGNPICVQCLRPLHEQPGQAGPPAQLTLRAVFPDGDVQVGPGQELILGRDPVHSPVSGTFSRYDNVSRRHATLGMDQVGNAWIRDERSTNGTFVNDRRLQPGEQVGLREGDSVRLAADARAQVALSR
jgi:FHA domain